jgi:hypothetical protein
MNYNQLKNDRVLSSGAAAVAVAGVQARELLAEQQVQAKAAVSAERHPALHATRHTAREANAELLRMAIAAPATAADVPAAAQANVHAGEAAGGGGVPAAALSHDGCCWTTGIMYMIS